MIVVEKLDPKNYRISVKFRGRENSGSRPADSIKYAVDCARQIETEERAPTALSQSCQRRIHLPAFLSSQHSALIQHSAHELPTSCPHPPLCPPRPRPRHESTSSIAGRSLHTFTRGPKSGTRASIACRHSGHSVTDLGPGFLDRGLHLGVHRGP
jgi:hypothetical protein